MKVCLFFLNLCVFSKFWYGLRSYQREEVPDTKDISRKKQRKQVKTALQRELKEYDRQGVSLWLDGILSNPREISKAHKIEEEGVYMRDYVQNEGGGIEAIKFDSIRKKK